jgi:hypothetical protein
VYDLAESRDVAVVHVEVDGRPPEVEQQTQFGQRNLYPDLLIRGADVLMFEIFLMKKIANFKL